MLSVYVGTSSWAMHEGSENSCSAPLLLLAFSACEASAGLGLLVAGARVNGSNLLKGLNLLRC